MLRGIHLKIGRRIGYAIVTLCVFMTTIGCVVYETLKPSPGIMEHMKPLVFDLPHSRVSLATGNLYLERKDFSLETPIGPMDIGAFYNSSTNQWMWNFEMTIEGHHFTDSSGAWHDISHVGIGEEIPGTHWIVAGPKIMRTRAGRTYAFKDGHLDAIHWANQPHPRLQMIRETVDGQSRLIGIGTCYEDGCVEPILEFEHDESGHIIEIKDLVGDQSALFAYGADGQLVNASSPFDIAEGLPGWDYEYASDALGSWRISSITSPDGERVEFEFAGPRQQLSRVIQIGEHNPEHHFEYSQWAPGKYETRVTQPDGSQVRYQFDALWRLSSVESEVGDIETFEWNQMRLASRTDKAGLKTTWDYVIENREIPGYGNIPVLETRTEMQPSGNVVVNRYQRTAWHFGADNQWALLSLSDSLGTIETRQYDEKGRILSVTNGAEETISVGYGPGSPIFPNTFFRSRDQFGYEAINDHEGHFYQAFISADVGYVWTAPWEYDASGNLVKGGGVETPTSAGRPGFASRSFDASRRVSGIDLWSEENLDTSTLQIRRRSDGQITRISRPHGGDTEYDYDALGRPVARREWVDGAWETTLFEYDVRDRQVAAERANGMRTETDHDASGQVVEIRHLRFGQVEKSISNTWEDGYLAERQESQQAGSEVFAYDTGGRLVETHYPQGETLEVEYDLRGRPTEKRYWLANGLLLRSIAFTYDAAGRPEKLIENGRTLVEWHYGNGNNSQGMVGWDHGIGSLERIQYGNGLTRTFEMKPGFNAVENYRASQTNGGSIENTQIDMQIDCHPGLDIPWDCIRVVETALPTGRADHHAVERYEFSPGHRIAQIAGSQVWLERSMAHARVAASGVWIDGDLESSALFHVHDELANQVSGATGETTWNPERNRLIQGGGHTYEYDAAGFAISRDEMALSWDAMGRIAEIGPDRYTWDSLGRPLSRIQNGTETRYLFGGEIEATAELHPTTLDLLHVRIDLGTGEHQYRHFDFRNNVQFVTDDVGDVIQSFTYNAYGIESMYDAATDTLSFAQGESAGPLVRLGVRLYDPDIGRFLSPDPIYQILNQYSYAEGNPVAFWDPDGEQCTVTVTWTRKKSKWDKDVWEILIKCKGCGLGFESGLAIAGIAALRHRKRARRRAQKSGRPEPTIH